MLMAVTVAARPRTSTTAMKAMTKWFRPSAVERQGQDDEEKVAPKKAGEAKATESGLRRHQCASPP